MRKPRNIVLTLTTTQDFQNAIYPNTQYEQKNLHSPKTTILLIPNDTIHTVITRLISHCCLCLSDVEHKNLSHIHNYVTSQQSNRSNPSVPELRNILPEPNSDRISASSPKCFQWNEFNNLRQNYLEQPSQTVTQTDKLQIYPTNSLDDGIRLQKRRDGLHNILSRTTSQLSITISIMCHGNENDYLIFDHNQNATSINKQLLLNDIFHTFSALYDTNDVTVIDTSCQMAGGVLIDQLVTTSSPEDLVRLITTPISHLRKHLKKRISMFLSTCSHDQEQNWLIKLSNDKGGGYWTLCIDPKIGPIMLTSFHVYIYAMIELQQLLQSHDSSRFCHACLFNFLSDHIYPLLSIKPSIVAMDIDSMDIWFSRYGKYISSQLVSDILTLRQKYQVISSASTSITSNVTNTTSLDSLFRLISKSPSPIDDIPARTYIPKHSVMRLFSNNKPSVATSRFICGNGCCVLPVISLP